MTVPQRFIGVLALWFMTAEPAFAKGGKVRFCGVSSAVSTSKLRCSSSEAISLVPLKRFTKLRELNLTRSSVASLGDMPNLDTLRALSLNYTRVNSLEPLRSLRQLEELDASNTALSDLAGVEGLSGLRNLTLWNVPVSDLRPLRSLRRLESLVLGGTRVRDLGSLAALHNLHAINLERTPVQSLEPLKKLKKLRTLFLAGTQLAKKVVDEFSLARPNIRLVGCHGKTAYPCAFRTYPRPRQCEVLTRCCDKVAASEKKAQDYCRKLSKTLETLAMGAGDPTSVMVRVCTHGLTELDAIAEETLPNVCRSVP